MRKLAIIATTALLTTSTLAPQAHAHATSSPMSSQTELNQWAHDPFGAVVWGVIKGAAALFTADPLNASIVSQYAMGPIGPHVGPIAELDDCANAVTSSNPTGAARYFGAGICMVAKPGLNQRFKEFIEGSQNPYGR